jgi:hypothetical protein
MLDSQQIVQAPAQMTAIIRLTIPRSEIRHVMAPARRKLLAVVAAQGLTPCGQ